MPIPVAPDGPVTPAAVVLALVRQVHEQVREVLAGTGEGCLNFTPGPGMNSIAMILRHLIGSEAETLRAIAAVNNARDRDSEFVPHHLTSSDALQLLAGADRLVADLAPLITPARLDAEFALPTLPLDEVRPGITWLVGNYGHAREHVGQMQLTKQLHTSVR